MALRTKQSCAWANISAPSAFKVSGWRSGVGSACTLDNTTSFKWLNIPLDSCKRQKSWIHWCNQEKHIGKNNMNSATYFGDIFCYPQKYDVMIAMHGLKDKWKFNQTHRISRRLLKFQENFSCSHVNTWEQLNTVQSNRHVHGRLNASEHDSDLVCLYIHMYPKQL